MRSFAVFALIATLLGASPAFSGPPHPRTPGASDKCPVCGMFVAKYPDFAAQILFKDGSAAFFDGAKDMFIYYQGLSKYNPRKKTADITSIYVTDYYSLSPVDAFNAYYVTGSNITGPMGRELIPLTRHSDAAEFSRDHQGKSILRFKEVSPGIINSLR